MVHNNRPSILHTIGEPWRRQKCLHAIIRHLRVVHRRYSKAVNLSNRCTTLYTVLYTVILRLFSSIRRFLTTPEQSFVEDPQRSILHREPISSNSLHDAKKKRERETQKLHATAIVSTFLPRKRNCTVVSALYRNLSRSTVWLESLYITFYGNLLTWSENKLGRNRSVETVCNPRGLRSSIRGNMQISKSILSKLFLIIVGILKFCY